MEGGERGGRRGSVPAVAEDFAGVAGAGAGAGFADLVGVSLRFLMRVSLVKGGTYGAAAARGHAVVADVAVRVASEAIQQGEQPMIILSRGRETGIPGTAHAGEGHAAGAAGGLAGVAGAALADEHAARVGRDLGDDLELVHGQAAEEGARRELCETHCGGGVCVSGLGDGEGNNTPMRDASEDVSRPTSMTTKSNKITTLPQARQTDRQN